MKAFWLIFSLVSVIVVSLSLLVNSSEFLHSLYARLDAFIRHNSEVWNESMNATRLEICF